MVIPVLPAGSEWAVSAHEALSRKPLGAGKSCSELTTPGAGTVPTREKDLSLESIFHIRMTPSHEPDAKTSEYRRDAIDVIHRGVLTTPSVDDSTVCNHDTELG